MIFRWEGGRVLTTVGLVLFNSAVIASLKEYFGEEWEEAGPEGTLRKDDYEFQNKVFTKNEMSTFVSDLVEYYGAIAVAHLLDVLKDMGFKYASIAGVTISKNDMAGRLRRQGRDPRGLRGPGAPGSRKATTGVRHRLRASRSRQQLWTAANEEVGDAMEKNFRRSTRSS